VTEQRRDKATIMVALVTVQLLVTGPGGAMTGVFFTPLMRAFGWNHAQVSQIAFASTICGGMIAPLVGWLLDRLGARWVMSAGMVLIVCGYWLASTIHSLSALTLAFAMLGSGFMLAGIVPVYVVFVNWFKERRGTAGGVVQAAFGVGLATTPPLLTWIILHEGWRTGFRWLSIPVALLVLPLTLAVVRTRPPMAEAKSVAQEVAALPGLDLGPALCSMMFWLVAAGDLLFTVGSGSVLVHQITYLIGLGYTPQHAALAFSAQTVASCVGSIVLSAMGDRYGARQVLCVAMLLIIVGIYAFIGVGNPHLAAPLMVVFAICWGLGIGCVGPLLPMLLAETIGLRRLGTLMGIIRFGAAFSGAFGPVLAGYIYDVTGSYVPAFELATAILLGAAITIALVRPAKGHDVVPAVSERLAVG
jgi:MFS family permease